MKVLVTGATGFLGWRTLEVLAKDDRIEKILATGRTLKASHTIKDPKVEYILGDLQNFEFVSTLVDQVKFIVHAAALSSPWGKYEDFENANVLTQVNLIKAASIVGIEKFVFISSPSIYFRFEDQFGITEDTPLPSELINYYAKTKRKAELLLKNSGLPYITLRPRAIIGRGDTVIMPRIIRAVDEGRLRIIGDGKNIVDMTSVENVANAILLSLFIEGDALNQSYNITNGKPVFLWDALNTVLKKLGKKPPTKKISVGLMKTLAGILEFKSRITNNKEPVLTKYGVGTLSLSLTIDISKAKRMLGYEPLISTEQSIDEFVKWYNEN